MLRSVQILISLFCVTMLASAAVVDNRLSTAAMNGDKATVQTLLNQNVDVNAPQGDGSTALHWAAYRDDLELAQLLIKASADVKAKTRLGDFTALHMASKNGNAPMIELLLNAGADAKSRTTTGTTSLMLAAASGSADAVKVLLDHGADANAKDINQGQTALMFAAALDRADVINLLVAHGADLNAVSLVPTPLKKVGPATGETSQLVEKAEQAAAQAEAEKAKSQTAEQKGEGQTAEKAAAGKGGKPGKGPLALGGMTALQFAARDGQMNAAKALIAAGADVNVPTASDKMTALTIAILNGHFDLARVLLEHGADPKPANTAGVTALFAVVDAQWAAHVWYPAPSVDQEKTSYLDLIKEILAHGADPNAKLGAKLWQRQFHPDWIDPTGATAFWRAAQANDVAAMKLLVAAGADPKIPTTHGCSPLQVAAGFGLEPQISTLVPGARLAAVKYLVEELGADVNSKDDKGYTPLHGAALTADNDLIMYLAGKGADVKARANEVFSGGDGPSEKVTAGTGDTVADMANGPRPHNLVYPDTVALLEKLGSENSDNCRASTCVLKTRPDKVKDTKKQ